MPHSVEEALGNRAVFESKQLNVLLEAMAEAVIVTGAALEPPGPTILYVNEAFERMTGYARGEVLGENPRMFQGPDTDRAVLDEMRIELAAGRTFAGEALNYRKDGSTFMLSWAVVPVFDDFGDVAAWLSLQRERGPGPALETVAVDTGRQISGALSA